MPSALFRSDPSYGYTLPEQIERCPIAELRRRLAEPLVSAGVTRDRLLDAQERDAEFRLLIASNASRAEVRAAIEAAFKETGELGDIRKLALYRFDAAVAPRLAALADRSAKLPQPFARRELKIAEGLSTVGPRAGVGRRIDVRFVGPVRSPSGSVEQRAAEVRIYLDLGYWVDAYREDDELAARVAEALFEYLGAEPEPAGTPRRAPLPGDGSTSRAGVRSRRSS